MTNIFFRIYEHLLPTGRAFRMVIDKQLRKFWLGLSLFPELIKAELDLALLDQFPDTTRELDRWDDQFALPPVDMPDDDRRLRLDAAWKARGGQNPRYIQDVLQAAGFDVYVHEWWEPGTEPVLGEITQATARDPRLLVGIGNIQCGELDAQCGEVAAQCGNGSLTTGGYLLVNKIDNINISGAMQCGEDYVQCGESVAQCGNFAGYEFGRVKYDIPNDSSYWPYFIYIAGKTFPEPGFVDETRIEEFEDLLLKLRPLQFWLGIIVEYVTVVPVHGFYYEPVVGALQYPTFEYEQVVGALQYPTYEYEPISWS